MQTAMKQMLWGDILFVLCGAFYLAWWCLAFKPVGAVKGLRSGWLLLPAFVAGTAAVVLLLQGIGGAPCARALFPSGAVLWGGIAAYAVLLAVTVFLCKRPATAELLLIVGWAMLALAQTDALYGAGRFARGRAGTAVAVIFAAALACLVCYILYYKLNGRRGYIDGMIPLLLASLVMAGLAACTAG